MLYHSARGDVGYTIVGTPTIVDGVASNFSLNSYCLVNTPFAPGNYSWEEQICFKLDYPGRRKNMALINSTLSDYLFPKIAVATDNSTSLTVQPCLSGNGTSWSITQGGNLVSYDYSKKSWVKLTYSDGTYTIKLKQEGEDFRVVATYENKPVIYQSPSGTGFSIGADVGAYGSWKSSFIGEIYLNETYIKVNEQPWFGICPIEVKKHQIMGPVGYNVVGSPTIADGVVSGFASGNYIATEGDTDFNQPFEISISCIKGPNRNQSIFSRRTQNNGVDVTFPYNNMCTIRLWLNNSVIYNVREDMGGFVLEENTKYVMKFTYDRNDRYYFAILSHITKDVLYARTIIESTKLNNCGVTFGGTFGGSTLYNPWEGSIDLNETYIKVNGKLWFWQPRETEKIVVNGVEVWTKPQES